MKKIPFLRRGMQSLFVGIGIVLLTSFTIDATDTLRESHTALSILADRVGAPSCPPEMELVRDSLGAYCVDRYEAGVGLGCLIADPQSSSETALNAVDADCMIVVEPAVVPWRFVTFTQAEQLCARVGKRLPTAHEWYHGALGTVDGSGCNLGGVIAPTGQFSNCTSGVGAFDMVGNVWEFVAEEVTDGVYAGVTLPASGYVLQTDAVGIATQTTTTRQSLYNDDYFWSIPTSTSVLLRGGYYGSERDGGLYSTQASIARDYASGAVGFRCVRSL